MLSFGVKGGGAAGSQVVDGFKMISNLANVGDLKTLAIHPWSTTHEQLSDSEKADSGVTEVRRILSHHANPFYTNASSHFSSKNFMTVFVKKLPKLVSQYSTGYLTIHIVRSQSLEQLVLTCFVQDLIRISVGTEHIDDIIADFQQSFDSATAVKTSGGKEENAKVTGTTEGDAKLVV